ncbi:MAG: hypothetical protein A2043_06040 [Candidatus Schekmanbacteria bacterium GWA2_38_9]|nr:MAG: hypothetical protein A2043_06040 [Candidatus Schekmanbacteria bacterium GWA2_38_9]
MKTVNNIFVLFLVISLFSCVSAQVKEKRIQESYFHYNTGISYLKQNKFPEAKAEFGIAIDKNPENPELHNAAGLANTKLSDYDEAVRCFKRALRLDPGFSEARYGFALTLALQKKFDDAVKEWKRVLEDTAYHYPERVHFNMANAYFELGDFESARENYNAVLRIYPDNLMSRFYLGKIYEKNGKYELACEEYRKSTRIDKAFVPAHFSLGENYFKMKKEREAIVEFEMVLMLDPDSSLGKEAKRYLERLK